jgi:hypothetical protein
MDDNTHSLSIVIPVIPEDKGLNDKGLNDKGLNDKGLNDKGLNDKEGVIDTTTQQDRVTLEIEALQAAETSLQQWIIDHRETLLTNSETAFKIRDFRDSLLTRIQRLIVHKQH